MDGAILSWWAVSQIFRGLRRKGIGFCFRFVVMVINGVLGFGFRTARGVMVCQGQLATVDLGLERIPFLGCASTFSLFHCSDELGVDLERWLWCARFTVAEGDIDI